MKENYTSNRRGVYQSEVDIMEDSQRKSSTYGKMKQKDKKDE